MDYKELSTEADAAEICSLTQGDFIIFKHSPRCSISGVARDKYNRKSHLLPEGVRTYLVNVITNRLASDLFQKHFGVKHESPQILFIRNGKCIYSASHSEIDPGFITAEVSSS